MPPAEDTLHGTAAAIQPGSVRGAAGFFRVARDVAGRWSFVDPEGRPGFVRAVHGVRAYPPGQDEGWSRDPASRLRAWGFNAVGVGGDGSASLDGLPFLSAVEFCRAAPVIAGLGVRLPDVFDPDWPRLAQAQAREACTPLRGSVDLLGWVTDSALSWGHGLPARRPGLLQVCLGLEPRFAAYHAAWEFVLAPYGGRLETLARGWGVQLPNKEVVREMTRADTGFTGRGYGRDDARWTREFARRYFTVTGRAIREADPNHLVLGCRFRQGAPGESLPPGRAVTAECVYPAVDVAMTGWRDLPDDAMPILPEVNWSEESFWAAGGARDRQLTSVERMLRRARAALAKLAVHPAVTGYVWSDWEDAPADRPPFGRGLVHGDGTEAREHTELLGAFNARAEALRAARAENFIS